MCRLLALAGNDLGEDLIKLFIDAFVESSKYDVYLEKITGGRVYAHDDGWGLIVLGLVNNKPTVAHHHAIEPIFHERSKYILSLFEKRISKYNSIYLTLHARKASKKEPYGLDYTHPFMRMSERCVAWFAHNGGANKIELAKKLGVNPWVRVDSELLGHYLMDIALTCIDGGGDVDECVKKAYGEVKSYVTERSALNTTLLLLVDDKISLYITHYIRGTVDENTKLYYTIIAYSENNVTLSSSITILNYLSPTHREKALLLESGIYRVEPGELIKIAPL
jgi:glutamine amidotransferase